MSKRSRTLRAAAREELNAGRGRVTKLSGPADAIAMIPYLFGFTPTESLVVVVLEGPRQRFGPCFRLDLVSDVAEADEEATYVAALVRQHRFKKVIVFCFSCSLEPGRTVVEHVNRKLAAQGVDVTDAIRADGSRWWSLLCSNRDCCGPEGNPYDVDTSSAAAEAVLAGMPRAPDRESLRAQVAAGDDGRRAAVAAAAQHSCPPVDVAAFVEARLDCSDSLSVEDIAAMAVAVQSIPARDVAWALMSRQTSRRHFDLWRVVMQSVPDDLLSPVGSLAAFAAWLNGNGVLASHAAERVLAVDPTYSMARLVISALESCVHPDSWSAVKLPAQWPRSRR